MVISVVLVAIEREARRQWHALVPKHLEVAGVLPCHQAVCHAHLLALAFQQRLQRAEFRLQWIRHWRPSQLEHSGPIPLTAPGLNLLHYIPISIMKRSGMLTVV